MNRIAHLFKAKQHVPVLSMYGEDMGLVYHKNVTYILKKDGDHWLIYSPSGFQSRVSLGGMQAVLEAISTGVLR